MCFGMASLTCLRSHGRPSGASAGSWGGLDAFVALPPELRRSGDAAASDAGALASLCVLAANSGVRPDEAAR